MTSNTPITGTGNTVTATLTVKLKPWLAPNFATRAGGPPDASSIPVADLDDDALEDMVMAWVWEVYRKAGRKHCPIYRPVKAAPKDSDHG